MRILVTNDDGYQSRGNCGAGGWQIHGVTVAKLTGATSCFRNLKYGQLKDLQFPILTTSYAPLAQLTRVKTSILGRAQSKALPLSLPIL